MEIVIGIVIAFLAIGITVAIIYMSFFNSLVRLKNDVEQAFSTVDVILKKRCDLIPNLVATVEKYMQFEQKTLTDIAALRSRLMTGRVGESERFEVENQVSNQLGQIMISVEAYPELKANQNFTQLLESLNEIEEQLSAARRFYNSAVTDYNNAVEMFPTNIIATTMSYRTRRLFEATQQERVTPNVKNLFNS